MINNGFDVVELDLTKNCHIPDSIQILVIADPRLAFSDAELAEIQRYIDTGRNMVLSADPGSQANANKVAEMVGGRFISGRLVADNGDLQQDLVIARSTANAVKQLPGLEAFANKITMPGTVQVAASRDKGFSPLTILASADGSWNEKQTTDFVNTTATFDPSKEKKGAKSVAINMTRQMGEKTQKILLMGDSDVFSNGELMRQRYGVMSANFQFLYHTYKWLCDGKYPVETPRLASRDNSVRAGIEALPYIKWGFAALVPFLMLIAAILIFVRRKSR